MALENLRGKKALVTGAARRLGRHIAFALADEGVNVVIHYNRSQAEALELQHLLLAKGVEAWTVQADFSDTEQVQQLLDQATELAGGLDLLINNASTFDRAQVSELEFAALVESLAINAWAPFTLSRSFCERVGSGQVINIIDSRADDYDFMHAGYILAKHMLSKLTQMLALKYAPQVAVNAIMPGLILPPQGQDDSYLETLANTVPLQRHGDPSDVAAAAVFLARSTFLTGSLIYVDGGRHLREYHHDDIRPDK